MNIALLQQLKAAGGAFVAPGDLIGAHIARDLDEITRWGYLVEHHPYLGVAYRGPSPRLCPDLIEWELGTRLIGRRVAIWQRVESTNDIAAAASSSLANDGLVVMAEEQTRGRGRRGRSWIAPARASLLMSVLIFPTGLTATSSWLTALGAVATAQVVTEVTGARALIKWPNDVRVNGRKIAGVLTERHAGTVIGIGLNVALDLMDLPESLRETTTSVSQLATIEPDRSDLARAVIRRLDDLYHQGVVEGPAALGTMWSELLEPLGRRVCLSTRSGEFEGDLVEAHLTHGLGVKLSSGEFRRFAHHDVLELDGEILGDRIL